VEQQQPDGFPAHFRNKASFHRLFSHEPHCPPRPARWWIAADHRDNSLSFRRFQQCRRAGALLVVKSLLQARHFVPASNLAHGFGSQRNESSNFGSRPALIKLLQRQSAQYASHRLHSAAEHAFQLVTVRLLEANLQTLISSHAPG
jgi:hypothetical protein